MTVTLVAMSSSGEVFITSRDIDEASCYEVHTALSSRGPIELTQSDAYRGISNEGLLLINERFETWSELDTYRISHSVPVSPAPAVSPVVEARFSLDALQRMAVDPLECRTALRLAHHCLRDSAVAADAALRGALVELAERARKCRLRPDRN